jgi:hypothetical protein
MLATDAASGSLGDKFGRDVARCILLFLKPIARSACRPRADHSKAPHHVAGMGLILLRPLCSIAFGVSRGRPVSRATGFLNARELLKRRLADARRLRENT